MSDTKYNYWFNRLVRSGYTPAASHERALTLARVASDPRIKRGDILPRPTAREANET